MHGSVANYQKQESSVSQAIDFLTPNLRIWPQKGKFATEPYRMVLTLPTRIGAFDPAGAKVVLALCIDDGFVKLLRLRRSSGERVLLILAPHPLGGPLRACYFGPTRESFPHLLTKVGR